MKYIYSIFGCIFIALGFSARCIGSGLSDILGPQVGVLEKIHKLVSDHRYEGVYMYLAPQYTHVVEKAFFVKEEKASGWTFDIKEIGTVETFDRISFFPIVVIVHNGNQQNRMHCVLFFAKSAAGWQLLNFPFLQPQLPEFASIPDWFESGTIRKHRHDPRGAGL